jgi:hypothetical protein
VPALHFRITTFRRRVVEGVIERHPSTFAGLEDLIEVLLNDPWGIRKPQDLATTLGIPINVLAVRCRHLGLKRLEHVLTLVRWLAFEQLIGPMGLDVKTALRLVGMRDRSNFRRQWRRAKYLLLQESGSV